MEREPPQYITTTAGNWLGSPESLVWSFTGKNSWIRKKAKDVNVGEQVLYHKNYVKTSIEEIEPFLERSPRYAYARDELHEKNNKGMYIPKLRALLLRGLNPNNSQSLEDKILRQSSVDFSHLAYAEMNKKVKERVDLYSLEHNLVSPVEETIKNWLTGETVTLQRPKKWVYYRALRGINSQFSDFDIDRKEIGSKFHCDYIFNTIRRCLMNYLAECKNKGKGPQQKDNGNKGKNNEENNRINITPELQATKDFFLKNISDDYVAARVTSTSNIRKRGQLAHIEKNDPEVKLSKGIVTEKPDVLQINELPMKCLKERAMILDECIASTILDYAQKKYYEDVKYLKLKENDVENYKDRSNFNSFLKRKIMQKLDKEFQFDETLTTKEEKVDVEEIASRTIDALFKGEIDDYYNLKKGTTINLFNSYMNVKKLSPKSFYKYENLIRRLGTFGFNESELKEVSSIKEQLKKEYPDFTNSKVTLGMVLRAYVAQQIEKNQNIVSKPFKEIVKNEEFKSFFEFLGKVDDPTKDLKPEDKDKYFILSTSFERVGSLVTRKDADETLKSYDLDCLMPFIEYNFLLEKEGGKADIFSKIKKFFKKK